MDKKRMGMCAKRQKESRRYKPYQRLFCTPSGTRTLDPLIKSQLLYQLSYGVMMFIRFRIASAKLRQFLKPAKKICVFFKKSAFFVVFLDFSAPRPPIFVIFGSKIR